MPHKHRVRVRDDSTFDLPPTQIAKPLPVVAPKQLRAIAEQNGKGKGNGNRKWKKPVPATVDAPTESKSSLKRKRGDAKKDDAPRAFRRMMAFQESQKAGRKWQGGLDDGKASGPKKKKQKVTKDTTAVPETDASKEVPTIRPGERFGDFAARVDAALPISGLINNTTKNGKDPLGIKVQRTKKERQMHKLYAEWRKEEVAIQEKRRDDAEDAEEAEMEDESAGVKWKMDMEDEAASGKKKKKGRAGRSVYEVADEEDDPWAELKKKRGEAKIGLHDVAKAPPTFKNLPKNILNVRGAAVDVGTVPKAAGSLRRREELQEVRSDVVASYRKMMESKRARLAVESEDK